MTPGLKPFSRRSRKVFAAERAALNSLHILYMIRSSLHTRSFRRIHLCVFRYRLFQIGSAGPKRFRDFRETRPGIETRPRHIGDSPNYYVLLLKRDRLGDGESCPAIGLFMFIRGGTEILVFLGLLFVSLPSCTTVV